MAKTAAVVADEVEAPEPEPTLRETLEAARDEVVGRQEAPAATTEAPAAAAPAETPEPRAGRDASGRFAPKEPAPAPAAASTVTPSAAAPAAAPPEPPQPSTLAPQFWTAQGKAIWKDVPEAARQEILRREREAAQQASRFDDERQLAKQFSEITGKHQAIVARTGQHPLQVYEGFLGIMSVLQGSDPNSKAALIRDVAMRNGIDLRALAGSPQNFAPGQTPAPAAPAPALPPEIVQTTREWQEHKAKLQREQEAQARAEQERVLQDIAEFRAKPEAEFFDAVKDQMIAMLNAGTAQTLDEAYNAAIWTRPDIRQVLLDRQNAAASTAAKQAEAARKARLKGGSIRGGSGAVPDGAPPNRSLREELQANFAEARSRL